MTIQPIIADILLGLAVALVLASCLGLVLMADVYQKVHFVTPISLIAPALVAVAVFVQMGLTENTGETLLALLFIMIAGPFLSHATVRAARIRERGDWRGGRRGTVPPGEEEE